MHLIYLYCQTRHLSLTCFKYAQNTYSCAKSSPMPWTLSYKEALRASCSLVNSKLNLESRWMHGGCSGTAGGKSFLGDSEGRNSLALSWQPS